LDRLIRATDRDMRNTGALQTREYVRETREKNISEKPPCLPADLVIFTKQCRREIEREFVRFTRQK